MTATPQVALVTGATSGIGKAAAIALAAAGFEVIGTGRHTARAACAAGFHHIRSAAGDSSSPAARSSAAATSYALPRAIS